MISVSAVLFSPRELHAIRVLARDRIERLQQYREQGLHDFAGAIRQLEAIVAKIERGQEND